jgi:hypothetical protein
MGRPHQLSGTLQLTLYLEDEIQVGRYTARRPAPTAIIAAFAYNIALFGALIVGTIPYPDSITYLNS